MMESTAVEGVCVCVWSGCEYVCAVSVYVWSECEYVCGVGVYIHEKDIRNVNN